MEELLKKLLQDGKKLYLVPNIYLENLIFVYRQVLNLKNILNHLVPKILNILVT